MPPVLSRFQFEVYDEIGPGIRCYNAVLNFDRQGQPVPYSVRNSSHFTLASAIPYKDFQTAAGFLYDYDGDCGSAWGSIYCETPGVCRAQWRRAFIC